MGTVEALIVAPVGILAVYAFAQTQVNENYVNESVDLFTAYESNHFFQESQEYPKMNETKEAEPQDPVQQKQLTHISLTVVDGQTSISEIVTLGGSHPLYIVDGKVTDNIESLLPENIESITILKEQSAIEQYGEKGKNGVVLITTKRNQSAPLFVVDGKEGGDLNSISVENIESISVLKDQLAIERYGEKGKNGVVIITTK